MHYNEEPKTKRDFLRLKVYYIKGYASELLKCGKNKIKLIPEEVEALVGNYEVTMDKVKELIDANVVYALPRKVNLKEKEDAKKRAFKRAMNVSNGLSTRFGSKNVRMNARKCWITRIRYQRAVLKLSRDQNIISNDVYRKMYRWAKANIYKKTGDFEEEIKRQGDLHYKNSREEKEQTEKIRSVASQVLIGQKTDKDSEYIAYMSQNFM